MKTITVELNQYQFGLLLQGTRKDYLAYVETDPSTVPSKHLERFQQISAARKEAIEKIDEALLEKDRIFDEVYGYPSTGRTLADLDEWMIQHQGLLQL